MLSSETIVNAKRQNFLILLAAFIFAMAIYYKFGDWITVFQYSMIASFGLVSLGLLVYKTEWFYFLLVGCIPFSIDVGSENGAQINFPSEGMLVLVIPAVILFQKECRKRLLLVANHPISVLLLIDLFIEFVSAIMGSHLDVSLKRVAIRAIFILGFYGLFQTIQESKKLAFPWLAYSIGFLPVIYFTLAKHGHYNFDPRVVFSICQPFFNDHTVYGACLAFVLPFLIVLLLRHKQFDLKGPNILLWTLLFLLIVASEFLALSRAAILSLCVSFVFMLLLHWKISFRSLVYGLFLLGAVTIYFSGAIYEKIRQNESVSNDGEIVNHFSSITNVNTDASNLERINRWICAVRMFENRPFFGFGPGTYQFEYNQFQSAVNKTYISTNTGNRGNAHSEYLTYLSEMGIFGFIVFLLIVFSSLYYGMQNHYRLEPSLLKSINLAVLLGLVSFYFHGLFNSFIDQSKMAFLFYAGLGTIVAIHYKTVNQSVTQ